jgi:hypothetical protein
LQKNIDGGCRTGAKFNEFLIRLATISAEIVKTLPGNVKFLVIPKVLLSMRNFSSVSHVPSLLSLAKSPISFNPRFTPSPSLKLVNPLRRFSMHIPKILLRFWAGKSVERGESTDHR